MVRTTYCYDMSTAKVPKINRKAYADAAPFLARLRVHRNLLTWMEWKTLRGQALAGDIDGAEKGLAKIIRRGCRKE